MYPTSVALPNQLSEAYLPLLLHLLYEFEQTTVVSLVARDEVGSAAEQVMAVLCPTYKCIKLFAAVA